MKRTLFLLLTIFTITLQAKEPWEIGLNLGGTLFHDILDDYWISNFNGGFEVLYPFHKRVPFILSGSVSHHEPNPTPPHREGFHATEYELLMLHFTIMGQFYFLEDQKVQPFLGIGLSTTTFFTSTEWPAPDYSDESEFGTSAGVGVQFSPSERVRIYSDYRFNLLFSAPYKLHFGTARVGIRMTLPKTGAKDEL